MAFDALRIGFAVNRALVGAYRELARNDRSLADQLRRAAKSIALNIAEGAGRAGRDRIHHYRIALGSARETRAALELAVIWGELPECATLEARELLDRVCAMLHRLTR